MRGFADIAERLRRSSVQILNRGGGGSGIVWDRSGRILTNSHVMRDDDAYVVDCDGGRFRAHLVLRDRKRDLALLESDRALEPVTPGDSGSLRAGQLVLAVGNPLGVPGAVVCGVVHSAAPGQWVQADISLLPGNSGGILSDAEGRMIGVNTMIINGLGLAVPSNDAAAFVRYREARAA